MKILFRRLTIFSVCHKTYANFLFKLDTLQYIYTHVYMYVAAYQFTPTLENHSCMLIKFWNSWKLEISYFSICKKTYTQFVSVCKKTHSTLSTKQPISQISKQMQWLKTCCCAQHFCSDKRINHTFSLKSSPVTLKMGQGNSHLNTFKVTRNQNGMDVLSSTEVIRTQFQRTKTTSKQMPI